MDPIISPRVISEEVVGPSRDLVRLGVLNSIPDWKKTTRECLEYIEVKQRINDRLDEAIRLERDRSKGQPHEL